MTHPKNHHDDKHRDWVKIDQDLFDQLCDRLRPHFASPCVSLVNAYQYHNWERSEPELTHFTKSEMLECLAIVDRYHEPVDTITACISQLL